MATNAESIKKPVVFTLASATPVALFALILLIIVISALPADMATEIIREGGIVESLSAIAWILSALIIGWKGRHIALALLPLFCGMRELDLHKAWTTDSVLKSKFYLGTHVSGTEKILALAVLLLFAAAFIYVGIAFGRRFYDDLRAKKPWAVSIAFSIFLLFVSKIFLDGMGRKLASLGIEANVPLIASIAEETMELVAAVLVLVVVVARIRGK